MTALVSYSTGLATVAAGGTSVTGIGTIWSGVNARPGDVFQIGNFQSIVCNVVDVDELTIPPWGGGAQTAVAYKIWQVSPQRFAGAQAMADVSALVAALNTDGFFFFVDVDQAEPDPSLGDDGQFAFQPTTGKTWVKTGGAWSYLGIYKAFRLMGAWSGATAYAVGDVVTLNGSSYVCVLDHTNHTPPNTTYWQVLASKGDTGSTGAKGDASGIKLTYSTTTTDADPGAGAFRLNNATPASATAAYIDNTQVGGASITAILDTWDDSTSATRGYVRFEKTTDPTVWAQFRVTGSVVDGSGYRKLTLTGGAGSGAFTNGDAFSVSFSRTGDAGAGNGDLIAANNLSELTATAGTARANLRVYNTGALLTGADFDSIVTGGIYSLDNTSTNAPIAGIYWYLQVDVYTGDPTNYVRQIATVLNGTSTTTASYVRTKSGGSWTAWKRLFGDVATKAQQQTATSAVDAVTPSNQHHHDSAAKAWVIFNAAGTIMASYGIASVSKAGTGQWVVNFSTAFASAVNYAALGSVEHNAANTFLKFGSGGGKTASGINVYVLNTAQVLTDPDYVSVAFYGRQ